MAILCRKLGDLPVMTGKTLIFCIGCCLLSVFFRKIVPILRCYGMQRDCLRGVCQQSGVQGGSRSSRFCCHKLSRMAPITGMTSQHELFCFGKASRLIRPVFNSQKFFFQRFFLSVFSGRQACAFVKLAYDARRNRTRVKSHDQQAC